MEQVGAPGPLAGYGGGAERCHRLIGLGQPSRARHVGPELAAAVCPLLPVPSKLVVVELKARRTRWLRDLFAVVCRGVYARDLPYLPSADAVSRAARCLGVLTCVDARWVATVDGIEQWRRTRGFDGGVGL